MSSMLINIGCYDKRLKLHQPTWTGTQLRGYFIMWYEMTIVIDEKREKCLITAPSTLVSITGRLSHNCILRYWTILGLLRILANVNMKFKMSVSLISCHSGTNNQWHFKPYLFYPTTAHTTKIHCFLVRLEFYLISPQKLEETHPTGIFLKNSRAILESMLCQKKSKEIQIILLKESSCQQGIYMTTRFNFPTRIDESDSDKKMFFRQFTWQSRHLHYRSTLGREKFFWFTYLTDTSLDKPSLLTTYGVFADESPNIQGSKLGQHQNCSFFPASWSEHACPQII